MQTAPSVNFRHILMCVCALAPLAALIGSCTYPYEDAWRCTNGRKDAGETDVDCGGNCVRTNGSQVSGLCALSRACAEDADCDRTGDEDGVLLATCVAERCVTTKPVGRWLQLWGLEREGEEDGPARRMAAAMAVRGDEVLLYGGLDGTKALDEARVFDAAADKWSVEIDPEDGPGRRYLLSAVDRPDLGQTWLVGGCRKTASSRGCGAGEEARSIVAYDWAARMWRLNSPAPLLPEALIAAGAAIDSHRRRLVISGGVGRPADEILELALDEDGADWVHLVPAGGPTKTRVESPLVYMENQRVFLVFGGAFTTGGERGRPDTWVYHPGGEDGSQPRWEDKTRTLAGDPSAPTARTAHAMAYDTDRHTAVLFGGRHDEVGEDGKQDTWEFDGVAWHRVRTMGGRPRKSFNNSMAYDAPRHRMLLYIGGTSYGHAEVDAPEGDQKSHSQLWSLTMLATPCEVDADCGSEHCVDRVCCDSACEVGVCNDLDSPGECQVD